MGYLIPVLELPFPYVQELYSLMPGAPHRSGAPIRETMSAPSLRALSDKPHHYRTTRN